MNESSLQLGVVQETLLIPLYFRALETGRPDGILRDPVAVQVVESLDYDFAKFDASTPVYLDIVIRTEIFDERVREFIRRHPRGTVINLGAGLCGRFTRVDNGTIHWFDLDMPDAIELRDRFFSEGPRNRHVARSMFDFGWLDEVEVADGEPVMVVAEGLFCYFTEEEVRGLLAAIAGRWPGAEILFQSISRRYVDRQQEVAAVNRTRAEFKWGVDHGAEVASWDPSYRFLGEWYFIDRHRSRWGGLRYRTWLPWVYRDVKQVMKISHLRLGER